MSTFDYATERERLIAERPHLTGAELGLALAEVFHATQRAEAEAAQPQPDHARRDPVAEAVARRAIDLAHTGAWPGPAPRSPATGRPIPPPPPPRRPERPNPKEPS